MKRLSLTVLSLFFSLSLIAQGTPVRQLISAPGFGYANIGVYVKNLTSGKTIVSYNSEKLLIPASVQKLFTTSAALVMLNDTVFITKLQYDGQKDDTVLNGNLYILGGGDPTLGSDNFDSGRFWNSWVDAVKKLGIKQINGNIIADASVFDLYPTPPKWSYEDLGNYYGAPPTGICIYDNTCKIYFKTGSYSGAPTKITKIAPEIPGLKIRNYVKSARIRSDQSYIIGAPFVFERRAIGRLPYRRDSFIVKGSIPDPPLLTAQIFKQKLEKAGIKINGQALTTRTLDNFTPAGQRTTFHEHLSPHINLIIKETNHKSINLYAEVLLNHLGKQYYGQGVYKNGVKALYLFADTIGIDKNQLQLFDGSGLSRYNSLTARALVRLLEYMYRSEKSRAFFHSLPVAGKTGTLKYFGRGTVLENRVFAKSGSMKRVRSYAGYMINAKCDTLAFAIIVNNFYCSQSQARRNIERFLIQLYNYD